MKAAVVTEEAATEQREGSVIPDLDTVFSQVRHQPEPSTRQLTAPVRSGSAPKKAAHTPVKVSSRPFFRRAP